MNWYYAYKVWLITQLIGLVIFLVFIGWGEAFDYGIFFLGFYAFVIGFLMALPSLLIFYLAGKGLNKLPISNSVFKGLLFLTSCCCILTTFYYFLDEGLFGLGGKRESYFSLFYFIAAAISCFSIKPNRQQPLGEEGSSVSPDVFPSE